MDKKFYIRYRIYSQKAENADRNYPKRLCKSLTRLHQNIKDDNLFWEREFSKEKLYIRTFIPKNLEHINCQYYKLIKYITQYFGCYAIWQTKLIPGAIKPINTFAISGYGQDFLLAYHYTTKIIDNLNDMRFNMTAEFRRLKINKRRRGESTIHDENSQIKSSTFFYESLKEIEKVLLENLEQRPTYVAVRLKEVYTEKYLRRLRVLHFRQYNYKGLPKIENAFSRENKFQNRRIIR
ncbi:MAG: hypothetical protein CL596_05070 [Alteromonas sp.]|nr:hypothetical protein [Alteromonas sp.]|tara:strand:- start:1962 stop:2672 length:711 start_codon:yes stop_codon:yes gene_type:complete